MGLVKNKTGYWKNAKSQRQDAVGRAGENQDPLSHCSKAKEPESDSTWRVRDGICGTG